MGKNGKNIEKVLGMATRRVSGRLEREILLVQGERGLRFPRLEVSEGDKEILVIEKLGKYFSEISGINDVWVNTDHYDLSTGRNPVRLYLVRAYGEGTTSEDAEWVTFTDGILENVNGPLEERTRKTIRAFRKANYL